MQPKNNERLQARNLYFGSDLSQQQIADLLNINRKTLRGWATEGSWRRAKHSAACAPPVLLDQYYHQLGALNTAIAERTEQPWPTKEEADVIRKITMTITQVKAGKAGLSETLEVFTRFMDTLRRSEKDEDMLKRIIPSMDKYVKTLLDKGREFDVVRMNREEEKDEKDYIEWLASQQTPASPSEQDSLDPNSKYPIPNSDQIANSQSQIPNSTQPPNSQSQIPNSTQPPNSQSQIPNSIKNEFPVPDSIKEGTIMGSPEQSQQTEDQTTIENLPTQEKKNGVSGQLSGGFKRDDENENTGPASDEAAKPPVASPDVPAEQANPPASPRRFKDFRYSRKYPRRNGRTQ